ncbi:MAG: stalk domain-containing protein, partial [Bacillota bacterium]|nr:stalk domain-containing protein [Bacillota bacterium]
PVTSPSSAPSESPSPSTTANPNSNPVVSVNSGIYGSGKVDIVSQVKSSTANDIYGSTVSMTVKDSAGNIYSSYDYVNGAISSNNNSYTRDDARTITLPGNDVYKLNAVVTASNGESSSITKEFDIRAVSSIPENISANFNFDQSYINATWTPLADVDKYVIFIGRDSGFSEYYTYCFQTKGYDNCSFFAPSNFYADGKWEFYLVAFKGDVRVGRSQEFTLCNNKDQVAKFSDKNLETVVRQALDKPYGDVLKSELAKISGLNASFKNISDLDGIQQLVNLETLILDHNNISNLEPLRDLKKLSKLTLSHNNVTNIEAIQNSTELNFLDLSFNDINDISPLQNLQNLTTLYLAGNEIFNYVYVSSYYYKLISRDFTLMIRRLIINGSQVDGNYGFGKNNTLLVSVRECADYMGLTASYSASDGKITLQDSSNKLSMYINRDDYILNGVQGKLDSPVLIVDGRTMVPIRTIAQSFNKLISYEFTDECLIIDIRDTIKNPEDLNKDGAVNLIDVMMIAKAFGSNKGEAEYNDICDLTGDGVINIADVMKLSKKFGYTYKI